MISYNLMKSKWTTPQSANVVPCSASRRQTHVQPLSLQFLSQAPPLLLALGAVLAASAVVLAGGRRASASHVLGHGEELLKGAKANGLVGLADGAGELTGVTLIPTLPGSLTSCVRAQVSIVLDGFSLKLDLQVVCTSRSQL